MEIAARLTAPFLSHLQLVLGHRHHVVVADDWAALERLIEGHGIDIVIVDPCADNPPHPDALQALIARHPSLPLVLYVGLSPYALRITLNLAALGTPQVVLRGFDDEPNHFRALVERQQRQVVGAAILAQFATALERESPQLAMAVRELFLSTHAIPNADTFATKTGLTRRSLDRSLARAGLASAGTLITGAKLARAYHFLRDSGYRMSDVAAAIGYSSSATFARAVRTALGYTPSALRSSVAPEQFIDELVAMLQVRRTRHPNAPAGAGTW